MGSCSEDPQFCWISRLLGVITFLSIYSTVLKSSGAYNPGTSTHLRRIRGGSVLFQVTKETAGAELEEISWSFGPDSGYSVMLKVHRGADTPTWVSLQDKYKQRVHVHNMTSLRIDNLILQDSGQYKAQTVLTNGKGFDQIFYLTIYEPVPLPQIQTNSISLTLDWCNVTLECTATGASEHLNVTWKSKGLPRELEQRGTPGPAPNPWTLTVRLPHSHLHASLTCVVSNYVDQKNATLELGNICAQDTHQQSTTSLLGGILMGCVAVILILGTGLFLWKTCEKKKKKMEMRRGAGLQEDHRVDESSIYYAQLMEQESQKAKDKGIGEQNLEEEGHVTTVYSEIRNQDKAIMTI